MQLGVGLIISKKFCPFSFVKISTGHWALTFGWVSLYFVFIAYKTNGEEVKTYKNNKKFDAPDFHFGDYAKIRPLPPKTNCYGYDLSKFVCLDIPFELNPETGKLEYVDNNKKVK